MPDKNDKIKLKIRNDVYKVPDKIYKIKLKLRNGVYKIPGKIYKIKLPCFENKIYFFPYIFVA